MKKLLIITSTIFLYVISAQAGVNIGITGMAVDMTAKGSETLKTSSAVQNRTKSDTFGTPEIFIENERDSGVIIGLSVIPMDAEISSNSLSRTDELTAGSSTVTNKASAEFSGHSTLYLLLPINDSGLFGKVGIGRVDVKSTESLGTGAAYGDKVVNFKTIGLGYKKDLSDGMFARFEGSYSDYESIELKSTGSDAVSTIKGDIDTVNARFTIGKSF